MINNLMLLIKLLLVSLLTLCNASQAFNTHVHGQSYMTIVLDNNQLIITVTLTTLDLTGFENRPKSTAEQSIFDTALTKLKATNQWLTIIKGQCTKIQEQIIHPLDSHEAHIDVDFSVTFTCLSPEKIEGMVIDIHEQFNRVTDTEVQWIVHDNQGLKHINKDRKKITFQ